MINKYPYIYLAWYRLLRYERVYVPLCKVAHTPFHIQGGDMLIKYFIRLA